MNGALAILLSKEIIKQEHPKGTFGIYDHEGFNLTADQTLEIEATNKLYFLLDSEDSKEVVINSSSSLDAYAPSDSNITYHKEYHKGKITLTNSTGSPIYITFLTVELRKPNACK